MEKFKSYNLDYPSGCIIAKVNLVDCIEVNENFRKTLKEKNSTVYSNTIEHTDWKGYAFQLKDVEKISHIPATGKLCFWEYEYSKDI